MAKKILAGVGVVIVLFLIVVATRPNDFHVERSVMIGAPVDAAFVQVNDFHNWANWSPFEKLDPSMTRTFDGPPSGAGAGYAWSGEGKAGAGKMTITHSDKGLDKHGNTPAKIGINLHFTKPFEATNTATFTFVPSATSTLVTWSMDGQHTFVSKAMCMFMDMDKMVGGDFEKGLATLKSVAEGSKTESAIAKP